MTIFDKAPPGVPLTHRQALFRIHLVFYATVVIVLASFALLAGSWWFLQSSREMGFDWGWEAVKTNPWEVAGTLPLLVLAFGVLKRSAAAAVLLIVYETFNVFVLVLMRFGLLAATASGSWLSVVLSLAYLYACVEAYRGVRSLGGTGVRKLGEK